MLYRHLFDKIFTKFRSILRVFVNFAGFRGFTWISRLRDRVKYQKPWLYSLHVHVYLNYKCTSSALIGQVWNRAKKKLHSSLSFGQEALTCPGHFLLFLINELILPGMTRQNPCPFSLQDHGSWPMIFFAFLRICLLCRLDGQGFWQVIPGKINSLMLLCHLGHYCTSH